MQLHEHLCHENWFSLAAQLRARYREVVDP
jgi:hypothetical protein